MGVPYSHISPVVYHQGYSMEEWCSCNLDTESAYAFHVPANRFCALCKGTNERQDHYHCGVCVKLTQVG